jgi:hypothetical protein
MHSPEKKNTCGASSVSISLNQETDKKGHFGSFFNFSASSHGLTTFYAAKMI